MSKILTSNHNLENRIPSIELLRIFLCISVILSHSFSNTKFLYAVELFFIIGGFFLADRIYRDCFNVKYMVNLYIKLLLPFFYIYILFLFVFYDRFFINIFSFVKLIFIIMGVLPDSQIIGWGDWYIGVYFWISIFIMCIFSIKNIKFSLFIFLILLYICIMMRCYLPYPGFLKTYFNIITTSLPRGFTSVGIGLLTGLIYIYLVKYNFKFNINFFSKFIITMLYSLGLIFVVCYLCSFLPYDNSYFYMQLYFCLIVLISSLKIDFITLFINRFKLINMISRYIYCIFCSQMLISRILSEYTYIDSIYKFIINTVLSTILGILIYHFNIYFKARFSI